ncbi:hypothetical protein DL766_004117 [Monosporascus sp. MC13-8B]|uniref:Circularly permuted ATP-grasp type 2 domain-containing protein n=1 Tax=Monosporascus cannonballus TaxID=155416 RepID=A0ABY0HJR0_9PEZI|nr:hypothetical protein DL762_000810 [Monosporascus cannonballus]RYO96371.1 hypothetical protein DL763_003227 [Monosporascus cannonballus]RYP32110.1 hypothetical protein DL766_004117 [Monosporascus sp. MC13-8B]
MPSALTLGVEEELHLVDLKTWRLWARAAQVLAQLPERNFKAELQRTTVEINTDIVHTLGDLREELLNKRRQVIEAAASLGLGIAAVGIAPRSDFSDFELTANGRFARIQEQYRLLVDEQLICGLQIHAGVINRDLAVQISRRVDRDLPPLLAVSASSPYWNGDDTGYASMRSIIGARWPSSGSMGPVASAAEYDEMLADLVGSGVIGDKKMAYFDVRPSLSGPTVELRVCDGCPIIDDVVLIAGLFRAMVRAAEQDIKAGVSYEQWPVPLYRAAMWQAARGGLSGNLLDATPHPKPREAALVIRDLVQRLRPQLKELGDWVEVLRLSETAFHRGNSADRQRAAFAEHGNLDDVMQLVIEETHSPASGPLSKPHQSPGTGYRPILQWARNLPIEEVRTLYKAKDKWEKEHGFIFGAGADAKPYPIDLLPRIIHEHEWQKLAAGLTQRARTLELFLRDVYGEQRAIKDGIVPADQITAIPGFRPEATRLPAGTLRATIQGFDLVRNEFGGWRVLEDNLRCPAGLAYAITIREMIDQVVPDLPRPEGLLDPRVALDQLRDTVFAGLGPDGTAVLLSNGPQNKTLFEQQTLAERTGMLLAQANDLERSGARILIDERAGDGRKVGADILDVAAAGGVKLINAPGNGVGDDKAVYTFVSELIRYYLDERPLLESVPTYRPSDPPERRIVLERVGQLVTKPVSGFGGTGVMVGTSPSAAEIAERREAIAADPGSWVAQEVVALSTHPTFDDDDTHLTPPALAVTRVAPPGTVVVNSSQGGGAKDTWIVAGDAAAEERSQTDAAYTA